MRMEDISIGRGVEKIVLMILAVGVHGFVPLPLPNMNKHLIYNKTGFFYLLRDSFQPREDFILYI